MLSSQTHKKNTLFLIGAGCTCGWIRRGLGLLLTELDSPILVTVGVIGVLAGIIMALNVDLGLLALIFITFTRFSDVLVNDHGLPSISKPFIFLLAIGIGVETVVECSTTQRLVRVGPSFWSVLLEWLFPCR